MKVFLLMIILLSGMLLPHTVSADILYLKNGHQLEGFGGRETKDVLEFEVAGGIVVFNQKEIVRIERSSEQESARIRERWEQDRQLSEKAQVRVDEQRKQELEDWKAKKALEAEQRKEEEEKLRRLGANTKIVQLVPDKGGHLSVETLINDNLPVTLVVDTGAPTTLLTAEVARQLGLDTARMTTVGQVMILNGNYDVGRVILKSVALGGLREESVEAYVLKQENPEVVQTIQGGLLGMSFLGRFHFAVNRSKKELLLLKDTAEPSSPEDEAAMMKSKIRVINKQYDE